MNFQEQINKTKITLFGNIWTVRLVKLLRYVGGGLVAWWITKSKYLFAISPWQTLQKILKWSDGNVDSVSRAIFVLSFAGLLIFIYFLLSGWLVNWLIKVNITPQQQTQILQKKTYTLDEKTSYSVNKFDNLEITTFRNYATLKGILHLSKGTQKKSINFVCHFAPSNLESYLETYFLHNNVRLRSFCTWQKITLFFLFLILLAGASGHVCKIYGDTKKLPAETNLGQVIKSKLQIEKKLADEAKSRKEREEKAERYRRAGITDPKNIDVSFEDIGFDPRQEGQGSLKQIVWECKTNARMIKEENANKKDLVGKSQHMILFGPPGTGKTMLAKAIAKESNSFFMNLRGDYFKVSIAEELGNKEGQSLGEKVRSIFDIALQELPKGSTIIALIDEIDQIGGEISGTAAKEFQTVVDDPKYANIIIIGTTNFLQHLNQAALRPGRLSKKLLVSYPEPTELFRIIEKVLDNFHRDKYDKNPDFFGRLGRIAFRTKFAKKIWEEMTKNDKYKIKYSDMGIKPGGKLDPEDGRVLFTGADVWKVVYEEIPWVSPKVFTETAIVKAVEKVYYYNRLDWRWMDWARHYLEAEIFASRNQGDDRKPQRSPGGPEM
ncbi:ATP-binding protein [endosymbiont GvMRE of Glomus versiforme]|uniref:ATP-binding protein n=1 Tax=endosymbiont GvMRE of Glomus versiforme TaxID=2039283 RepID=UPI000EC1282B|nr:ATP-binding protein [endosymbiont GvMRE of Glomus versiforme]RHZ36954.1 AAA family ATPase [endosymbiont GvMRE of Glomus versiforme]